MISKKELELRQSECSTPEKIVERDQKENPYSKMTKYADTCSLSLSPLEAGFHISSTKSSEGETVNTRTRLDERTYEIVLNKGDLIEFGPFHSFTYIYGKAKSHWAVYIGSETIERPNTPYYVEETEEFFTKQKSNTLKYVYTTKEHDKNTNELRSIVRMGELFHVAKVQIAELYQMEEMCLLKERKPEDTQLEERTTEDIQLKEGKTEDTQLEEGITEDTQLEEGTTEDTQLDMGTTDFIQWRRRTDVWRRRTDELKEGKTEDTQLKEGTTENTQLDMGTPDFIQWRRRTDELDMGTTDFIQWRRRTDELDMGTTDFIQSGFDEPLNELKEETTEDTQLKEGTTEDIHIGGTVYRRIRLDERTDKHVLNKGDLIEFSPCNSIMHRYPPYSHHVHKDGDGKALSHWAVYLGSGTIAGPNTPCYVNVMTEEVPLPNERNMILIIRYPKEERNVKDADELKTIVRIDELFQIANVQNAQAYQNNQKDAIRILQSFHPRKEQDSNTYRKLKDVDKLTTTEWTYELPQVQKVQIAEPYQDNQMNEISKLKPVCPTKEEDKDTDIKLTYLDTLNSIVWTDDPEVQIAEPYPNNQMDEMFNSTKSSVGETVNTRTRLDERTYEKVLNKGDLIEFCQYHSITIRYPPYSDPDNKKCIEHKDVGRKARSHWAVYIGSRKVAHVAGPKEPYCIRVLRDIPTTKQRLCLLKAVYPRTYSNPYLTLKNSDDLRPIVRIDDLFQVAKVQNAVPYQNNQMDEMFIAGTPTEIVNIAKDLVDIALPHDFITKDCKDFAVFCRYGENLHSIQETQLHEQSINKIVCIGMLAAMIAFVALKLL